MRVPRPSLNPIAPRSTDAVPDMRRKIVRSKRSFGIGKRGIPNICAAATTAATSATPSPITASTATRANDGSPLPLGLIDSVLIFSSLSRFVACQDDYFHKGHKEARRILRIIRGG